MSTSPRSRVPAVVALLAASALGACDEDAVTPAADGTQAQVSVYLTDAPGGVDSVWVQVDDIILAGETNQSVLAEATGLLNITSLRDSTAPLALAQVADTGTYREIRFVIGGAVLQTSEGTVYATSGMEHPHGLPTDGDLICPSCAQSGIKVKLSEPVTLSAGDNGLLLDFDVGQSFGHAAGHSGKWVMHPVIHGAHGDPDDMENDRAGGEIHGMVVLGVDGNGDTISVPECAGAPRDLSAFVPMATASLLTDDADSPLEFAGETEAEDDGFEFEIEVAAADIYFLGYRAQTPLDGGTLNWVAEADPVQVTINEAGDEVTGVVYTVTNATCDAPAGS